MMDHIIVEIEHSPVLSYLDLSIIPAQRIQNTEPFKIPKITETEISKKTGLDQCKYS